MGTDLATVAARGGPERVLCPRLLTAEPFTHPDRAAQEKLTTR